MTVPPVTCFSFRWWWWRRGNRHGAEDERNPRISNQCDSSTLILPEACKLKIELKDNWGFDRKHAPTKQRYPRGGGGRRGG